jgi:hypothetical protein
MSETEAKAAAGDQPTAEELKGVKRAAEVRKTRPKADVESAEYSMVPHFFRRTSRP